MNKVILMGRLTKEPEIRYTANNIPVCSFTLAVDNRFSKDENKKAEFFNVVAWRNTAEFVGKYFTKGLQVVVSGRLQNRTWEDSEGKKRYVTEVVADETYFADSKKGNNNTDNMSEFMPPTDADSDDTLPF